MAYARRCYNYLSVCKACLWHWFWNIYSWQPVAITMLILDMLAAMNLNHTSLTAHHLYRASEHTVCSVFYFLIRPGFPRKTNGYDTRSNATRRNRSPFGAYTSVVCLRNVTIAQCIRLVNHSMISTGKTTQATVPPFESPSDHLRLALIFG